MPTALPQPRPDETLDRLLRGRVSLLQARRGYRTSIDAMLLGVFAGSRHDAPARAVDLGAGSGLVSILLGLRHPALELVLVERQESLAERAERNLLRHGLTARATVLRRDIAGEQGPEPAPASLLVSNPPFYRATGRMLPTDPERRDAHYESTADLRRFAQVAARWMTPGGESCWVFPAEGEARLLDALAEAGLADREIRRVGHDRDDMQPRRILVAARQGPARVDVLDPWALHEREPPDGRYHPEIEAFLASLPMFPGYDDAPMDRR